MIRDMNGVPLYEGDTVLIHQEEGIRKAEVKEIFHDCPTVNEKGFWVDVDSGDGLEGMMSYILEKIGD